MVSYQRKTNVETRRGNIKTFVNELIITAGRNEAEVSGFTPGVYVYKPEANEFAAARKMVIVGSSY